MHPGVCVRLGGEVSKEKGRQSVVCRPGGSLAAVPVLPLLPSKSIRPVMRFVKKPVTKHIGRGTVLPGDICGIVVTLKYRTKTLKKGGRPV